jgi:hypothetical protein
LAAFRDQGNTVLNDALGAETGDVPVLEQNVPRSRRNRSNDRVKQGAFTCPIGPDQGCDFAFANRHRNAMKHFGPAITAGNGLDIK